MEEIVKNLLPALSARGVFGKGEFLNATSDDNSDLAAQFGSVVSIVKVNMRLASGDENSIPVVIKVQFPDEVTRRYRDSATMFLNEVNMYKSILPFLNTDNILSYPKLYYGYASSGKEPEKDVLIVENIKHSGFSLSPEKLYLNYDLICLAMKTLGQLHAWSYNAKAKNRNTFFEISKSVKNIVVEKMGSFDFEKLIFNAIKRGVMPLMDKGKDMDVLNNFLQVMESVWSIQDILFTAEEPFGVILHGDFCKNNIFYKFDSTGKPSDCMYFDFQLSKYGSPAIDLSFFLYMHTNYETRETNWDDFLKIYWNSVRNNVHKEVDLPNFQEFLDHFSSRAVYGYIHCSYFAPQMLLDNQITSDGFNGLSDDEKAQAFDNVAGDEGRKCIVDIVSHLLEKGYIQRFLDFYKKVRSQ